MIPKEIANQWCSWPGWTDVALWQAIQTTTVLISILVIGLWGHWVIGLGDPTERSSYRHVRRNLRGVSRRLYKLPLGVRVKRFAVRLISLLFWQVLVPPLRILWSRLVRTSGELSSAMIDINNFERRRDFDRKERAKNEYANSRLGKRLAGLRAEHSSSVPRRRGFNPLLEQLRFRPVDRLP